LEEIENEMEQSNDSVNDDDNTNNNNNNNDTNENINSYFSHPCSILHPNQNHNSPPKQVSFHPSTFHTK
jgi:hypothetical protein